MAIAKIKAPEAAAPDGVIVRGAPTRRRRVAAIVVPGILALVLAGMSATGVGHGSDTSRSQNASSRRLEAAAAAHLTEQANIARGRAADSARLQAAANAVRCPASTQVATRQSP